jgi:hypothetical protein
MYRCGFHWTNFREIRYWNLSMKIPIWLKWRKKILGSSNEDAIRFIVAGVIKSPHKHCSCKTASGRYDTRGDLNVKRFGQCYVNAYIPYLVLWFKWQQCITVTGTCLILLRIAVVSVRLLVISKCAEPPYCLADDAVRTTTLQQAFRPPATRVSTCAPSPLSPKSRRTVRVP